MSFTLNNVKIGNDSTLECPSEELQEENTLTYSANVYDLKYVLPKNAVDLRL